jgi:hypothetical protein
MVFFGLAQTQVRIPAGTVLFALWGKLFSSATPLIKHSLCFPLSFNVRFCINHNVLLVVRVVGHWKWLNSYSPTYGDGCGCGFGCECGGGCGGG